MQRSGTAPASQPAAGESAGRPSLTWILLVLAAVGAAFAWAYWPTLVELVRAWDSEPDYSHGFFVVPLAVFFLWVRRDRLPEFSSAGVGWFGVDLDQRGGPLHRCLLLH